MSNLTFSAGLAESLRNCFDGVFPALPMGPEPAPGPVPDHETKSLSEVFWSACPEVAVLADHEAKDKQPVASWLDSFIRSLDGGS